MADADTLRWFRDLALARNGYEVHGARGWAHLSDVPRDLEGRNHLTRLAARGLLSRVSVPSTGAKRLAVLYRITPAGVEAVGTYGRMRHVPVVSVDAVDSRLGFWLPSRSRVALRVLCAAYRDPAMRPRVSGLGWISVGQFEERMRLARAPRPVGNGMSAIWWTLRKLVAAGLAERRYRLNAAVYRASDRGRSERLLEWAV